MVLERALCEKVEFSVDFCVMVVDVTEIDSAQFSGSRHWCQPGIRDPFDPEAPCCSRMDRQDLLLPTFGSLSDGVRQQRT